MLNLDSGLGIEFGRDRLVLASVKRGFQDFTLKNSLVIENYRDLSEIDLKSRVQEFLKANGFNRENIVVGLPRDQLVVRQLELPLETEENLDQVVSFQQERFEPAEEPNSYYDYWLLRRDEKAGQIVVQLVMVGRSIVDDCLRLLQDLDLPPAAIRPSTAAFQNLLLAHRDGLPKKGAVLGLSSCGDHIEVTLIKDAEENYSDVLRGDGGPLPAERILDEAYRFVTGLEKGVEGFSKLYVGGDFEPAMVEEIQRLVPDVEILIDGLQLNHRGLTSQRTAAVAGAVGLAISGLKRRRSSKLNLIPEQSRTVGVRPVLVPTYVLTAVLILLVLVVATRGHFQQERLLESVKQEVASIQPQVNQAVQLRGEIERRQAEVEELAGLMQGEEEVLSILRDLTERIPDDTYLQNIQFQRDGISIQGFSDQASTLAAELMESPYLAEVKTDWIRVDTRSQRERFKFSATLKPQGGTGQ